MPLETKFYDPLTSLNQARITPTSRDQIHLAAVYAVATDKLMPPTERWIQFFDRDTLPELGAFPRLRLTQPHVGGPDLLFVFQQPIQFVGGLWWASSLTPGTYTPVDPGEQILILQAQYK